MLLLSWAPVLPSFAFSSSALLALSPRQHQVANHPDCRDVLPIQAESIMQAIEYCRSIGKGAARFCSLLNLLPKTRAMRPVCVNPCEGKLMMTKQVDVSWSRT